jgi:uncharacterized protein DUF4198
MPFEGSRVGGMWLVSRGVVRDLRDDALATSGVVNATRGMIAVERIPFDVDLDAEKFNTYVEDEGHYDILRHRIRSGEYGVSERERVTRHLKTFVGVPAEDGEAFLHVFGTKLEIVPLSVPMVGKPLAMRIMYEGKPLADARVSVFGRDAEGKPWLTMVRTNRNGEAGVVMASPGFVMVRTSRLEQCRRCDVDYRSDWAALTFNVQ